MAIEKLNLVIDCGFYSIDRKHQDYLNHLANYPDAHIVQMDIVYSTKGGPGILILFFVGIDLMLGYYLESFTTMCVVEAIQESFGDELFKGQFTFIDRLCRRN